MIEIKGDMGEKVLIDIHGRLNPNATDKWDFDFLESSIKASVPGFTALFDLHTRSSEIEYWMQQAKKIYSLAKGDISLRTIEENILINLRISELGKAIWNIELRHPEGKNKLYICLENGLSDVEIFANQLSQVLKLFPSSTLV